MRFLWNNEKIKHELLDKWFVIKEIKHSISEHKIPRINNGEVWWTAIGENVGVEINGKSGYFFTPSFSLLKIESFGVYGNSIINSKT